MSDPSTESTTKTRSLSRSRLPIFGAIALVMVVLSYAGVRSFFSKPKYGHHVFWIPIADCDDSTGLPHLLTENATIEELESALGSRVIIEGVAEIKKRNKERSYVVGKHIQVRVPELDGEPSIDGQRVVAEGCLGSVYTSSRSIWNVEHPHPNSPNMAQLETGYFHFLNNVKWHLAESEDSLNMSLKAPDDE